MCRVLEMVIGIKVCYCGQHWTLHGITFITFTSVWAMRFLWCLIARTKLKMSTFLSCSIIFIMDWIVISVPVRPTPALHTNRHKSYLVTVPPSQAKVSTCNMSSLGEILQQSRSLMFNMVISSLAGHMEGVACETR